MHTTLALEPKKKIIWIVEIKSVVLVLGISAPSVIQKSSIEYLSYHENYIP